MATIEQIETLLDKKLSAFKKELLEDIEMKIQQNSMQIQTNASVINQHETIINDCKEKIKELEDALDDQLNRSMRNNIVLKGVPEDDREDWEATKSKVTDILVKLSGDSSASVRGEIDRAHRGGARIPGKPRHIYANLSSSTRVDFYIKKNISENLQSRHYNIHIDRQYTKKLTERRNNALKKRKELLEAGEIKKGHIVYPAKLMIKKSIYQNK